ncbi:MAG TPA: ABC transporter ATP-binding protein [Rudaea sp.]
MSEPLVELENVGVAFAPQRRVGGASFWAIEEVSMTLHRGERLGVIGRNGAGKSTLLRTIAGIIAPDRGRIRRARVSCQLLSLNVGFMTHLSGRDNAILSGLMLGLRRREIVSRLPKILEFSELGDFFDQPIATYSTGMVVRLGFSVAMQVDPEILLIDEVLSVGDSDFQEKSGAALRERIHGGTTVVFVSHSDAQIRSVCTRALWVEHGRSVLQGGVDDVLAAYHAEPQRTAATPTAA